MPSSTRPDPTRAPAAQRLLPLLRDGVYWALQLVVAYAIVAFAMAVRSEDPSTLTRELEGMVLAVAFFTGFLLLALVAMGAPPEPTASAMVPVLVVGSAPWPDRHWAFAAAVAWLLLHLATSVYVLLRGWRQWQKRRRAAEGSTARRAP